MCFRSVTYNQISLFSNDSTGVWHMEVDLYKNDGSILFATWGSLKTAKGMSASILMTVSTYFVPGFEQINKTHVAVPLYREHCVKILNRKDNSVQTLAGTCGTSGDADGRLGTGKFYYPYGAELDIEDKNILLVIDSFNHALRSVNLLTGELGTVIESGFSSPRSLLWVNGKLLVTNSDYVSEVSWSDDGSVTNNRIAGTFNGYADGKFNESQFNYPIGMAEVGPNLFLVADHYNNVLRLLDFNKHVVGPVCIHGEVPCANSSNLPFNAWSILIVDNDVYLGLYHIHKLSGQLLFYSRILKLYNVIL